MITIIIKNELVQRYVIHEYESQPLAIAKMWLGEDPSTTENRFHPNQFKKWIK